VRNATEKESSQGNDMAELEVWIFDKTGNRRLVFDYLVNTDKAAWKVHRFAASCGLLPQYQTGTLISNEMIGRTGLCKITTQKATQEYAAKNIIQDYIKAPGVATPASKRTKAAADDLDDVIPF
jgi:hypothetical protein